MAHFDMITVADSYFPLAGRPIENTIRLYSDKYSNMRPGDTVTMTYTSGIDSDGELIDELAVEELKVSSIAVSSFAMILHYHGENNHTINDEKKLSASLKECYPELDAETEFMAIYFGG